MDKVYYISQPNHLENIAQVCQAGIKLVQLRMKAEPESQQFIMAQQALQICQAHGAKLIINDNVDLANQIQSHGVHLGKNDMQPAEARKILGQNFIIGGTANTFEDCMELAEQGVDYIGLGPLKYTTTKKNLSPVLGIEGYQKIISQLHECYIHIPVYAIGGITPLETEQLAATPVYGIAISGFLSNKPAAELQQLLQQNHYFKH